MMLATLPSVILSLSCCLSVSCFLIETSSTQTVFCQSWDLGRSHKVRLFPLLNCKEQIAAFLSLITKIGSFVCIAVPFSLIKPLFDTLFLSSL